MNKSTFFTGQPIFNQLLNFIPRSAVYSIGRDLQADRYYKSFKTYDHLVAMLYSVFHHCHSLREVTTGMLAWDHRIQHLGINSHPRRSTLADANKNRNPEVFEKIYYKLLARYNNLLPDSRRRSCKDNLYIFDSTSITLFQEILKGPGVCKTDGRKKGGIKVHTLLHSGWDVPTMVRYSAAAQADITFLKNIKLPAGSVIVFDKGYRDYGTYNRFTQDNITWVSRLIDNSVYKIRKRRIVTDHQLQKGITCDHLIELGHSHSKKAKKVTGRLIGYRDPVSKKHFRFITNNEELSPLSIANYYRQRWQIETFFKRIKQNYPLQYFLGDSANAIKIQIWCALIADLLLKVVKQGTHSTMSYSNIRSLIRLHLMTYMDLKNFLKSPEKSLLKRFREQTKRFNTPLLFAT
jgi:hypothetical protein